jgi:hypothetical protein
VRETKRRETRSSLSNTFSSEDDESFSGQNVVFFEALFFLSTFVRAEEVVSLLDRARFAVITLLALETLKHTPRIRALCLPSPRTSVCASPEGEPLAAAFPLRRLRRLDFRKAKPHTQPTKTFPLLPLHP